MVVWPVREGGTSSRSEQPTLCGVGQGHKPLDHHLRRLGPREPVPYGAAGGLTLRAVCLRVVVCLPHRRSEIAKVNRQFRRHAAQSPVVAALNFPCGKRVAGGLRDEIVRGPAARYDWRHSTRHRFEDRQAEAFAPIRRHQAVAGRAQAGQLPRRHRVFEVDDLRQ